MVNVTIMDKHPSAFCEVVEPSEHGFQANLNPADAHPRRRQVSELLPGSSERLPTQIFNGYADQVAALYAGSTNEKLFM
jgi:sulfoxide reductase catalytic subunit YedY